jgi:hypothetical protein
MRQISILCKTSAAGTRKYCSTFGEIGGEVLSCMSTGVLTMKSGGRGERMICMKMSSCSPLPAFNNGEKEKPRQEITVRATLHASRRDGEQKRTLPYHM